MNAKKQIRAKFRNSVFARDGHVCRVCGGTNALDAHHIIDRHQLQNGGYVPENGITLCDECHVKAEKFHQTDGQEWVAGFHPNDLFARIGSSRLAAQHAASQLNRKICEPIV